jgi:hypothetical protein
MFAFPYCIPFIWPSTSLLITGVIEYRQAVRAGWNSPGWGGVWCSRGREATSVHFIVTYVVLLVSLYAYMKSVEL